MAIPIVPLSANFIMGVNVVPNAQVYTETIVGEIGASHQPVFGELVRISLDSVIIQYPI